jgi:hypothetical protein
LQGDEVGEGGWDPDDDVVLDFVVLVIEGRGEILFFFVGDGEVGLLYAVGVQDLWALQTDVKYFRHVQVVL